MMYRNKAIVDASSRLTFLVKGCFYIFVIGLVCVDLIVTLKIHKTERVIKYIYIFKYI